MQVCASSLPASPPNEIRTSPPIARSAPIWAATGSAPMAVTPPHSGVQPLPPATTKARLNCFTPVACAVVTRLNGGKRLVSTYGANPAAPAVGEPDEVLGDGVADAGAEGDGDADVGCVEGDADGAGVFDVALAEGAGLAVEDGLGAAPPWHAAPFTVQSEGCPAWPADAVTKPTATDSPGATAASQPSLVTVTRPPSSV